MRGGGVDWQLVKYSRRGPLLHHPGRRQRPNSKGAAYNATADRRSWEAMKAFFAEVLKG